jgi:predicted Zn-dependent protease
MKKIISLLVLFLLVISCARNPVTGKSEFMLISEQDEIEMGRKYDPEIVQMYGVYNDPKLSKYIDNIGQKMVKISHRPNLKFEIKVMDSPVVNAFAVPGGYLYITRGILAYLNDEAQLAGVMGHEIGHVTARHSAKQQSKAQLAQIGLAAGSIFVEGFDQYAGLAGQAVGLLFLKFGRDDESQSDQLGVQYSTKVGYNAHEMAGFFHVLDELSGGNNGGLPDFLSTHPNPADRVVNVNKLADKEQKKYSGTTFVINRDNYLNHIDGIIFGNDPQQGFSENNVFYHPGLKFQFPTPQGWQVNNLPSQVQMVASDEKAVMIFKLEATESETQAATKFITDNKLQVISQKTVNVHGSSAQEIIATANTQQGVLQLMAYYIKKDNNVYSFLGYSAQADFQNNEAAFKTTMGGLQTLTDKSKLNRQPDRIKVRKVTSNTTLENALKSFGITGDDLQKHALINDAMKLSDPVAAGMMLKTVAKGN